MSNIRSARLYYVLGKLRELHSNTTPGPWGVTTWAGGLNFSGPKRLHGATDRGGEPTAVPSQDADFEFIRVCHSCIPAILDAMMERIAGLEKALGPFSEIIIESGAIQEVYIRTADILAARAALAPKEGGEP